MAATIDIEVESGVFTGTVRHHQGYYAGDFGPRPVQEQWTESGMPLLPVA
jgi:hypothetical protein